MQSKRIISVVGCHAEGEVGRAITGGVLPPPGATLFDKKRDLETEDDGLRRFLWFEPHGGTFVHVNLVLPSTLAQADAGFIIMEPTDYPLMSGSNSICVATVLPETGMLAMQEPITELTLETSGGLVQLQASCDAGRCKSVRVTNVPSFLSVLNAVVEVESLGAVSVDIAYGGEFFAIIDAQALGF